MERPDAPAHIEVAMDPKPSTFDEEAYRRGLLGPVIRFGKMVSSKYSGWTQKDMSKTAEKPSDDDIKLKTS